jgi:hypothetical protein
MGNAANGAKTRWNASHYTQVKVSVKPEIAAAFKAKCLAGGVSMASAMSRLMAGCGDAAAGSGAGRPPMAITTSSRPKRRKLVDAMRRQLEQIRDAEQRYLDAIPENLQGGAAYDAAEESISLMDDAIDLLKDIY